MFGQAITVAWLVCAGTLLGAQEDIERVLAAFTDRVEQYVAMHRRIEGPVPALQASQDLTEVRRLMTEVRRRIKAERSSTQGQYFTPEVRRAFRARVASVMTQQDIQDLMDDLAEHSSALMPPIRVYEPLPVDTPFIAIPPRLFKVLPPLPAELRYVIIDKGLVLWDHHADLVVDLAPGVLDPRAFRTFKSDN